MARATAGVTTNRGDKLVTIVRGFESAAVAPILEKANENGLGQCGVVRGGVVKSDS
jgi:hypothetical protein